MAPGHIIVCRPSASCGRTHLHRIQPRPQVKVIFRYLRPDAPASLSFAYLHRCISWLTARSMVNMLQMVKIKFIGHFLYLLTQNVSLQWGKPHHHQQLKIIFQYCQSIWMLPLTSFEIHNTVYFLLNGNTPVLLYNQTVLSKSSTGCGCRIYPLHLCKGVRVPLYCHRSQINSGSGWLKLIGPIYGSNRTVWSLNSM